MRPEHLQPRRSGLSGDRRRWSSRPGRKCRSSAARQAATRSSPISASAMPSSRARPSASRADTRLLHLVRRRDRTAARGLSEPSTSRKIDSKYTQRQGGSDDEIHQTRCHPHHCRRRSRRIGSRFLGRPAFAQDTPKYKPEDGATLRLLRWSPFVQGDEDQWLANTKRFTEATGVQVRVDKESWEDIRPKAAVAANVGSGPDLMLVWFDDAHQYPDKLLDVTDLADYLGNKYGGWYDGPKGYADARREVRRPAAGNDRQRHRLSRELGQGSRLLGVPEGHRGFPRTVQGAAGKRAIRQASPMAMALATATTTPTGCCGAMAARWSTRGGKVAINSPETLKAIEYAMELYKTFIPGTESWLDVNNNRAFLAGELSVIANGISVYNTAKTNKDNDPKLAEIAKDIRTTNLPIGPVGTVGRAAPDNDGGDLQLHALSERGQGLSAVHVRGAADEGLDHLFCRLLLPDAEGLRQQSGMDRGPEQRAPTPRPRKRCGPTAMPGRSAMRPPRPWPTTYWSTCSPRRSPARRRRRRRWKRPRSAPTGTTGSSVALPFHDAHEGLTPYRLSTLVGLTRGRLFQSDEQSFAKKKGTAFATR